MSAKDKPLRRAVPDDPAHPERSASHAEPVSVVDQNTGPDNTTTPAGPIDEFNAAAMLTNIATECKFMSGILREIQAQLSRIERGVKLEQEEIAHIEQSQTQGSFGSTEPPPK